jgi:uncharacterized Fe-S radical SAM superfamily protein PflX
MAALIFFALARLASCDLCPRCGVGRLKDVRGFCRCGRRASGAGFCPHFGEEVSANTYLNVMAQYRPEYNACRFPELCRTLSWREYAHALHQAEAAGLTRGLAML